MPVGMVTETGSAGQAPTAVTITGRATVMGVAALATRRAPREGARASASTVYVSLAAPWKVLAADITAARRAPARRSLRPRGCVQRVAGTTATRIVQQAAVCRTRR